MKVLLAVVVCHVTHGGRGVPRPRPLGKLTAPRGRPLNDDLTGDGRSGCGNLWGESSWPSP